MFLFSAHPQIFKPTITFKPFRDSVQPCCNHLSTTVVQKETKRESGVNEDLDTLFQWSILGFNMGYFGEHPNSITIELLNLNSKGHLWRLSVSPMYIVTGPAEI